MAQLAANGTTLFNGIDASTAPLRYALRVLASEPDFLAAPHQVIARLRPRADVTTHPAFRNSVRMTARLYDALHDPKSREVLTCATDTGNRGWTMRFFRSARSAKDLAADRDASGAGLRTAQAAAGGGAAIIPALAKAVIAAAGKWWRAYNIRRARIAAVRELHALDDRMLGDIGVSRSEIERVVVHGRDAPQFHSASRSPSTPHFEFRRC
jgi:uncharacterized protein YjiS (DUF1127 family)